MSNVDEFLAMHADTPLSHAGYDAQARREYYLRTRKLKGRAGGSVDPKGRATTASSPSRVNRTAVLKAAPKKPASQTMEARVAQLKGRLDRLKSELAILVAAAKVRSGVDPKETKKKDDSKEPEKKSSADKKKDAERAKEYREKNQKPSEEVEQLQKQIEEVTEKIEKAREALKAALAKHASSKPRFNVSPNSADGNESR
jgi:hypothetical protein